ncbi:ribbon-helix-helix protein, CopG family [Persephonella sp.]|uniref:ribbon-helix-helix protein, CopG family n=1 Tax=Persephonella sp. TaxID=2060922 RepID=UPI00261AFA9C|nr:ribbon-helix-helix protein, CopG family [Persephonella sp.]
MKRTQIYLDEEIYKYLKAESKRTGKSLSEIIREKLRTDLKKSKENLLKAIEETAGIWQYKTDNVEEALRNLRKGKRIDSI